MTGILDGKVVIVTGAGAGLGRAYAEHAASEGAAVVVNDIDRERGAQTVGSIADRGGRAVASDHNVADWDAAEALVALAHKEFQALHGLVNNAGVLSICEPGDETEASIRQQIEINLMGAVFVGTHAIRAMKAAGGGTIVNATSAAQMGISKISTYGATKGALASLTYGWALDLKQANIRVNGYSPVASTQMTSRSPIPVSGVPTAEANAAIVSYLLSDLSDGITGQVVQRRGPDLLVMCHPDYTQHQASADAWDTQTVIGRFDSVLRAGLQPVGDPRLR